MATSLRQAHREQTRDRILRALSEFIVEDGLEHLTLPAVARKAGVGVATLYRHFATKEQLLTAFFAWLDELGTGVEPPQTPDELVELLPRLYDYFDRNEAVIRAGLMTGIGREFRARQRAHRWRDAWPAVVRATEGLDGDAARRIHSAVRLLVNSQAWLTLRDEQQLSGAEAGEIAGWMLQLVLREASR